MERITISDKSNDFPGSLRYRFIDCKMGSEGCPRGQRKTCQLGDEIVVTHPTIAVDIAASLRLGVSSQFMHCKSYELRPASRNNDSSTSFRYEFSRFPL